jgi:hypothetical protein
MYLMMPINVVLACSTQQRNIVPSKCVRNCLKRDTEDGMSLAVHRSILQTLPDLPLPQMLRDPCA